MACCIERYGLLISLSSVPNVSTLGDFKRQPNLRQLNINIGSSQKGIASDIPSIPRSNVGAVNTSVVE